jgi:hypothetical protein
MTELNQEIRKLKIEKRALKKVLTLSQQEVVEERLNSQANQKKIEVIEYELRAVRIELEKQQQEKEKRKIQHAEELKQKENEITEKIFDASITNNTNCDKLNNNSPSGLIQYKDTIMIISMLGIGWVLSANFNTKFTHIIGKIFKNSSK